MPLDLMESAHSHLIKSSASKEPDPGQVQRSAGLTFYGPFAGWLIILEIPALFLDTDNQDHCSHMLCRLFA